MARQSGNRGDRPLRSKAAESGAHRWIGWAGAGLVIVALVVAVSIWMSQARNRITPTEAEVKTTPIVGGMTLATVTAAPAAAPADAAADATSGEPEVTATTGLAAATPAEVAVGAPVTSGVSVTTGGPVAASGDVSGAIPLLGSTLDPMQTPPAAATTPPTVEPAVEPAVEPTVDPIVDPIVEPTVEPTAAPPAAATPASAAEPQVTEAPPTPTAAPLPPLVLAPGEQATVAERGAVLHAAPGADAPALDSYGPGSVLVVLEPGEDFTAYPVEVDGQGWVRVRAADGLVGWAASAALMRGE